MVLFDALTSDLQGSQDEEVTSCQAEQASHYVLSRIQFAWLLLCKRNLTANATAEHFAHATRVDYKNVQKNLSFYCTRKKATQEQRKPHKQISDSQGTGTVEKPAQVRLFWRVGIWMNFCARTGFDCPSALAPKIIFRN